MNTYDHTAIESVPFHLFHKWTPWVQYVVHGTDYGWAFAPRERGVEFTERRQKCHCVICGKEKDEIIA